MNALITLQDSRFNYSYKGFCSIVCAIIDIGLEHYTVYQNLNCFVLDPQTLKLFDNLCENWEEKYDAGSWWLDRFFSKQLNHTEYSAHTIANFQDLKLKNKVFNSILKIKANKIEKFEQKYSDLKITDDTLAIQIRGTDKKNEIPEPKIENIFRKIDYYFETEKVKNVFLSTDDAKYLNLIKDRYQNLVIYDNTITISHSGNPLHTLPDREKINEEVLSNVYLLSKCKHFLYSFSNVSLLALIMGANDFQTILNLNK